MHEREETYISVILPLKLDWIPFYRLERKTDVKKGDWVRVDFANKEYSGIIYETDAVPEKTEKIKTVLSVLKGLPAVTEEELRLWEMTAGYYMCSIGEVFKAAYPAVKISQEEALAKRREREREKKEKSIETLNSRIAALDGKIRQKKMMLEKSGNPDTKAAANLRAGIERLGRQTDELRKRMQALSCTGLMSDDTFPINFADIVLSETQQEIYRQIPLCSGASGNTANTMRAAYGTLPGQEAFPDKKRGPKPVLIKGVTGSGKTEIYLKAASETLVNSKNVLYLVPEIAMSRQLTERTHRVFGDLLLTFHSDKSDAEKRDCADRIRRSHPQGLPYIVLGTRSALFLPHRNLGLIIVDEEHDSSYKQDSPAPRYNGRDVAVMMSAIHGCSIILGSATPSLESVFNCMCGKYAMLELNERFYRADDAETVVIDTAAERRKRGMTGSFSRKLIDRINLTVKNGEQVLILRSRRAFSPVLQCPECGEIPKCPHCNVSLSFHKGPDRMVCHHCGYTAAFNPACPKCGSTLQGIGSGTQRIEEEARALFPDARIARLDSDTDKTEAAETVRKFDAGDIDILIGTQIVSKGFDFPGLTLTAVIAADSLLGIQDFRADEKAMQALEQLRGRCGRREKRGTFVIQTYKPEHPVYKELTEGNSRQFYEMLMSERKEFGYPPYTRIINLTVRDASEARGGVMAGRLYRVMKEKLGLMNENSAGYGTRTDDSRQDIPGNTGTGTISEPFRPPVDKIGGMHLWNIRITLRKDRLLREHKTRAAAAISEFEKRNRYTGHVIINVDPE